MYMYNIHVHVQCYTHVYLSKLCWCDCTIMKRIKVLKVFTCPNAINYYVILNMSNYLFNINWLVIRWWWNIIITAIIWEKGLIVIKLCTACTIIHKSIVTNTTCTVHVHACIIDIINFTLLMNKDRVTTCIWTYMYMFMYMYIFDRLHLGHKIFVLTLL